MSLVMPLPPPAAVARYAVSRSSTPGPGTPRDGSPVPPTSARIHSRPGTPPLQSAATAAHLAQAIHTISAPPTPVNTTHLVLPPGVASVGMERCRSSEAVLSHHHHKHSHEKDRPRTPQPLKVNTDETNGHDHDKIQVTGSPVAQMNPLPAPVQEESIPQDVYTGPSTEEIERADEVEIDERMDIDEVEVPAPVLGVPTSDDSAVWGMPKWGLEVERPEVRPGVRLVGMEELPGLIERHSLLDTPSQVLFPWLHGISDDGMKGREMGAFFGHAPPFEPPPYRGLTIVLSPPHPADRTLAVNSPAAMSPFSRPRDELPDNNLGVPRDTPRETNSSSSSGSVQSNNTDTLSPTTTAESLPPLTPPGNPKKLTFHNVTVNEVNDDDNEADVQMHPCVAPRSPASPTSAMPDAVPDTSSDTDSDSFMSEEDTGPSCILMNAMHAQDIFELPMLPLPGRRPSYGRTPGYATERPRARFRPARLPNQINLRNLHIQQIKYATISDIVVYAKNGVSPGILEVAEAIAFAQEELYRQRMAEFYAHVAGRAEGEGFDRPVKYGVWVVVEPFSKIERYCPHLVNIDSDGAQTDNSRLVDLFEREAFESRAMTRATEVIEGFWVGNDTDVPGGADDGAGATVPFDLCVKASECSDMPTTAALAGSYRSLVSLDRLRQNETASWSNSPATMALRSLLSPGEPRQTELGTSPDESHLYAQQHAAQHHYVAIECAGSCRTITGQMRNLATMTDKVIELVTFLRKLVEGRDKTGIKRTVLVHCQDGYTESSIIVLSYIMATLGVSLPEAYLYLQLEAKRSFFLYPTDRPLLHRIEAKLAQERREKAIKTARTPPGGAAATPVPPSPTSRWKPWGFMRGSPVDDKDKLKEREREREERNTRSVDAARRLLIEEGRGGTLSAQEARVWFEDKRFDGFPSRILPFLYLGNLEHAGNAAMLKALGITHVVSVGESLLDVPPEHDPLHGYIGANTLGAAARSGHIQVLDLTDVRDDGNDPLRPVIARACEWMEQARAAGGSVLVHCRVGVSRSASIVVSTYKHYKADE